jgi:VWFA-related protein
VEVVVRNKSGPVTNLTKDDFTILDQGKGQRIDIFRSGQSTTATPAIPPPPGMVSNRGGWAVEGTNAPSAGYTAVLYDRLNTRIDYKDYERKALVKLIRSMAPHENVAIYVLGRDLHVVQDFTDDPAKLLAAIQHLDSGRDLMPTNQRDAMFGFETDATGHIVPMGGEAGAILAHSVAESAAYVAQVYGANKAATTAQALSLIIPHLSGMRGRRNLVWMMDNLDTPRPFIGMLLQSGIALYPVLARSLIFDPSFGSDFMSGNPYDVAHALTPGDGVPGATLMPDVMDTQHKVRALGAMTGGDGFGDAEDLQLAVKTAQEDSRSAYTLGYYPAEDALDGKFHSLTVKLTGKQNARLEIRYRPGYVASKQVVEPTPNTTLADLFRNPLDDTGLGISGRVEPDTTPGLYTVHLVVDLHDVQMTREGNRSKGRIEMALAGPELALVRTLDLDLSDAQLADSLRNGVKLVATGIPPSGDAIRVAMRDPATGLGGSLRISIPR